MMILPLIVLWSFWFWFALVASFVWIFVAVIKESGLSATFAFIVSFLLFILFSEVPVIKTIFHHPVYSLVGLLGYIAIGLVWSMLKWYMAMLYIKDMLVGCIHDYNNSDKTRTLEWLVNDRKDSWGRHGIDKDISMGRFKDDDPMSIAPSASTNKEVISFWVIWWPFSVLQSIAEDLINRIVDMLIDYCRKMYENITKRVFGSVKI